MHLKDTQIKNARSADKAYKLADGEGLHLEIKPSGSKLWRLRYRLHGKESVFSIGKYPAVSLLDARGHKNTARSLIAKGINPSLHRKQEKLKKTYESRNTFKAVAEEWLERNLSKWADKTYLQRQRLLVQDAFPYIGNMPIRDIDPAQVLSIIQKVERRAPAMATIIQQAIGATFRLAVITLRADSDPTQAMRGVIQGREVMHHKSLDESELPDFLKAVDNYQGYFANQLALHLAVLTLARSNEVLQAAWAEFDFEKSNWKKPAGKVKNRKAHTVPLSAQALEILHRLQPLTGHREHLFPNRKDPKIPASKGVLWKAFVSMGYKDKFTPHGLRGTGSTILNEMGFRGDVIEKQLDHSERNKTRDSYNHAEYLEERRVMMQTWADYLDGLKSGADVVPIHSAKK
jgi:integrase